MMVSIVEIGLYTKPVDEHTKRTFPVSLALKIRSICSTNETFKLRCDELTQACTIPLLTWIQSRSPQPGVFTSCRIPPSRVLSTVGFIVVWGGEGEGYARVAEGHALSWGIRKYFAINMR